MFSGTHNDLIGKLFKQNKLKIIENFLIELRDIFEDRFYIEIQRHKDPADQNFESFILSLSGKLNIPLIATQEVFYLNKDMYEAHDALICIGEKNYINDDASYDPYILYVLLLVYLNFPLIVKHLAMQKHPAYPDLNILKFFEYLLCF